MGKTDANTALHGISGGIDNWVYRRFGDRLVISRRPTRTAAPSEAQLAVQERFRLAADYTRMCKQDPALLAVYQSVATAKATSVHVAIMTDYLNPPVINALDLSTYQGRIGDVIRIRAFKDAGVSAVNIAIRDAALTVLEEGSASLQNGMWLYTATTPVVVLPGIAVTATAVDRPGNTGTKTHTFA